MDTPWLKPEWLKPSDPTPAQIRNALTAYGQTLREMAAQLDRLGTLALHHYEGRQAAVNALGRELEEAMRELHERAAQDKPAVCPCRDPEGCGCKGEA